jgi:hypothetical protein
MTGWPTKTTASGIDPTPCVQDRCTYHWLKRNWMQMCITCSIMFVWYQFTSVHYKKNALVNDVNGCICSQTLKEKWLSIMWEERWLEPVFLTMKAVDECYVAFFKASLATFAHFCIQRVKFLLSPIHFNTWHEVPERAWHVTWMQQSNSVWRRSTMTPSTWNSGASILVWIPNLQSGAPVMFVGF